ncbi:MAG: phage holin family protein [Nitrospirota bacterium]|nr:phage holin family protein [Nitrospirota bacterium]
MRGFVLRLVVTGIAVLAASEIVPGIRIDSFASGLVGVVVLAILNALVRPILYLLSAPFILVTLGLFMVVINALMLELASTFVSGFHVAGFWSAVGGAILISFVSGLMNLMVSEQGRVDMVMTSPRERKIRHIN